MDRQKQQNSEELDGQKRGKEVKQTNTYLK